MTQLSDADKARFEAWAKSGRLPAHIVRATVDGTSTDALKLASEEYRVCSARADELSRVVWQSFIGIVALSGAAGAGLFRVLIEPGSASPPPQGSLSQAVATALFCLPTAAVVVFLLSCWRRVSQKWALQQQALYDRLNYLEYFLGYRTNSQFRRVDDTVRDEGVEPIFISEVRDHMAVALIIWWSGIAAFVSLRALGELIRNPDARMGIAVAVLVLLPALSEVWVRSKKTLRRPKPFKAWTMIELETQDKSTPS